MASFIARKEPLVIADGASYDKEHFLIPRHYDSAIDSIMISNGQVIDRVEKLAKDILSSYANETVHLLCVLKGGSQFFQDLCVAMRKVHDYSEKFYIPYTFDFIRVSSYEGTESSGEVKIEGIDLSKLAGKHVVFVEDIIDTGLTMTKLCEYIKSTIAPASVQVASLLEKRTERSNGFKALFVGFSIPDRFVIGYGLDYNEVFRDLNHICIISEQGISQFAAV